MSKCCITIYCIFLNITLLAVIAAGVVLYFYPEDTNFGVPQNQYKSHSKNAEIQLSGSNVYVLSIDGGGVFGIVPTKILIKLETEIRKCLSPDNKNREIWQQFQVIGGTSTGSIITAGLVTPVYQGTSHRAFTPEEIYDLYMKHATQMFHSNIWARPNWIQKIGNAFIVLTEGRPLFNAIYIDSELKNVLGTLKNYDALTDFVIPFYIASEHTFAFADRYGLNKVNDWFGTQTEIRATGIPMLDIAMYSLSAPGYFRPYIGTVEGKRGKNQVMGVDGGLYQANPVFLAIAEARHRYGHNSRLHVLSLGTGLKSKTADYPMDENGQYEAPHVLSLIKKMSTLFLETPSLVSDYFLMQDPSLNYMRIDGEIPSDVSTDMSDASASHLKQIDKVADSIAEKSAKEISSFAASICWTSQIIPVSAGIQNIREQTSAE